MWVAKSCKITISKKMLHNLPSGEHTNSNGKWPFIVDFPINNGDFPLLCCYVKLPDGKLLICSHPSSSRAMRQATKWWPVGPAIAKRSPPGSPFWWWFQGLAVGRMAGSMGWGIKWIKMIGWGVLLKPVATKINSPPTPSEEISPPTLDTLAEGVLRPRGSHS